MKHRLALTCLLSLPLLGGCDSDCDQPARIDGAYNVWSNVVDHTPAASALPAEYPVDEIFYNGRSEWQLKYVPASSSFDLVLDDQAYSADFRQDATRCNAFHLSFDGTYVSTRGAQHQFTWEGDLVYFGTHIGGTWGYSSDWTDPATSTQGHIVAVGEMNGNVSSDTGF